MDVDPVLCQKLRQYCYPIVGCCQEVHKEMGPFLNEYMYQDAMVFALEDAGFTGDNMTKEYYFTTKYKDREIKHPHKVPDFITFLRHQIAHIENQWIMLFKWVTQGDASIFSITFVPCSYVRKSTAQVR